MHHLESLKGKKTWLWHETPNPEESKKWDWSYKCRNEDIIRITKTTRISSFTEKQYLKFITCTTRLEDDSFQTRTLIGVYWATRVKHVEKNCTQITLQRLLSDCGRSEYEIGRMVRPRSFLCTRG